MGMGLLDASRGGSLTLQGSYFGSTHNGGKSLPPRCTPIFLRGSAAFTSTLMKCVFPGGGAGGYL